MVAKIHIVTVDKIDQSTVLVEFSDDTYATFTVDQLLFLSPERIPSNLSDEDLLANVFKHGDGVAIVVPG